MDFYKKLSLIDVVNFGFWLAIFIFYVISFPKSENKLHGFLLLSVLLLFLFYVVKIRHQQNKTTWQKLLILFYPAIFLILIFDSIHLVLTNINSNIYDAELYQIDRYLFGADPTVWIERFINPYLTEFMYYVYLFYFPMPLFILYYLYKKKMFKALDKALVFFFMTYYGSYLLYFLVPALGPRFYPELVQKQTVDLKGLWLTDIIRDTISSLEHNKFDAFPSLHAAITLVTVIAVAKYQPKWLWFFVPVSIGIFISLVYCRYHYVIDIIAGVIWTLIVYFIVEKYYDKWYRKYFVSYYSD